MNKPTLLEAFVVGKLLQQFIHSSHCFDARDMGRFWGMEPVDGDIPAWLETLGAEYDRQVNWSRDKDHGVFIAHKVIREFLEKNAE